MLERESISITEASRLAGYASAADFSTAFKREFGMKAARGVLERPC